MISSTMPFLHNSRGRLLPVCLLWLACTLAAQQAKEPVFPYGAVYFRKSNPPEADWERDHKTAADAGMNSSATG
jgi:beta-galactosidase